jgi:hypothetical protein
MHRAVLGSCLSGRQDAAALAGLKQLVAAAKQPYEVALAKLRKRQQLQAMLQTQQQRQQQQGQVVEAEFSAVLEVYLQDVLTLFDACTTAAAASSRVTGP